MAALSEVLNTVQKKASVSSSSKQVKFAPKPVMISTTASGVAATAASTLTNSSGPVDTTAILESIPTATVIQPITSSTVHSPVRKNTPSKVKGTIPVGDFSDPKKVKNVLVSSMPSSDGVTVGGGTDHTYAAKEKLPSIDTSSSEDSSSSSDDSVETNDVKSTPIVNSNAIRQPEQPTSKPTPTGKGRGRPRKQDTPMMASTEDTPTHQPPQLRSILKPTPPPPPPTTSQSSSDVKVTFDKVKRRGRGCGNCAGCLREDCGNCCYCLDKPKFGGPGKKKQRCALRVCAHFVSHKSTPTSRKSLSTSRNVTPSDTVKLLNISSSSTPKVSVPKIEAAIKTLESLQNMAASQTAATPSSKGPVPATPTGRSTKQNSAGGSGGSGGSSSDDSIKCVMCGRERKINMSRSNKFCSSKCLKDWEMLNPGKSPDEAEPYGTNINIPMLLQAAALDKPVPRALKNLQIDMALPGERRHDPITTVNSDLLEIGPLISTIAGNVPMATNQVAGTKRGSQDGGTPPKKSKQQQQQQPSVASTISPVTSPVVSSTPVVKHSTKKGKMNPPAEVSKWSISDVVKYFEDTGECSHIATVFHDQEVDGEALLLLSHDSLVKCLGMKLGPALKVMTHVDKLKSLASSSF